MRIFTDQERKIVIVLSSFLVLGIIVNFARVNLFNDSSEKLKLVGVSDEISGIYGSTTDEQDTDNSVKTLINVNTADAVSLTELPGIGPALAGRIIDYREKSGEFKSLDDLKKIRGIGDTVLKKLQPFIEL